VFDVPCSVFYIHSASTGVGIEDTEGFKAVVMIDVAGSRGSMFTLPVERPTANIQH